MAFEKYPYTNFHDLNLDWILAEVKRVGEAVDHWGETVLEQSKAYTDDANARLKAEINQSFQTFQNNVNTAIANFENSVNGNLNQLQLQIKEQNKTIDSNLAAAQGYTDLRISQNNNILMDEISKGLIDLKVLNIFTGKYVTVQEMFNYLAAFHLTGAVSIAEIARFSRTVNTVVGYNKTCTEFVIDGRKIFEQG